MSLRANLGKLAAVRAAGFILLLLPSTGLRPATAQDKPFQEVYVSSDVMIPIRDGTRLATDIYRPAQNGALVEQRFPVVMEHTPYNKERGGQSLTGYFLRICRVAQVSPHPPIH